MKLFKKIVIFFSLSIIFSNDCSVLQSLYDSNSYLEAYSEIINLGGENLTNDKCILLAYNTLFKLENFNEAKKYLDKLLKNNPDNSDFIKLSDLLTKVLQNYKSSKYTLEKIDVDDAINEYKNILKDEELKNISLFHSGLGMAYKKKFMNSSLADSMNFDLLDLSISSYNKAQSINKKYDEEIKNIAKYLTNLGKNSMSNDELDKALAYFSKATEYDPNYNVSYFYLGQLYMKIQDYELAIESYESGLGSNFKNGNYKILYLLGTCYQKLNKFEKAETFFQFSINNEPTYTKARFALANLYYKQQDFEKSKTVIFNILDIDSNYIKAYELLINILLDTKNYKSAREYAIKGLEINTKSYFLYSQLAFLDNEEGKYESAITNSNDALSLKRNYGPALIALATANVYLCNKIAAEDAFKKAKRYDRRQVKQLQDWANQHFKSPACK